MGVYIPNMKMPEHCGECRFAVDGWCYAYGKPNIDALANDGRTNFCPLVPVPPHGDLIARDALLKKCEFVCTDDDEDIRAVRYSIIENAPTILEAEEGET